MNYQVQTYVVAQVTDAVVVTVALKRVGNRVTVVACWSVAIKHAVAVHVHDAAGGAVTSITDAVTIGIALRWIA